VAVLVIGLFGAVDTTWGLIVAGVIAALALIFMIEGPKFV
jgi:hypothetical protein